MEIMWPVLLFVGLVWLRRVNPLYRQHECEKIAPVSQSRSVFLNQRRSLCPQATSLTRPCPLLASCLGSKVSSATPTILVSNTPLVGNLQVWCPTTTTPCKPNEIELKIIFTILGLESTIIFSNTSYSAFLTKPLLVHTVTFEFST